MTIELDSSVKLRELAQFALNPWRAYRDARLVFQRV